jgi:hypothetical protein
MTQDLKVGCNVISALAAIAAAALWYRSSAVTVPHDPNRQDADGTYPASISVNGTDFIYTAVEQTRWNRYAAIAASVAALTQAVALLLPS